MSRRRWHERRPDLLEAEKHELEARGFRLQQDLLDANGQVVFRGELARGEKRNVAEVIYPAAFHHGASVHLRAPGLPIGRHIEPRSGLLCLDHPGAGESSCLRGAEAVERAEELWRLSEEAPDELVEREARAPDPHANYVEYEANSAIFMTHPDLAGIGSGAIRLGLSSATPYRGALIGLRADDTDSELEIEQEGRLLAGPLHAAGPWRRLDERPPAHTEAQIADWVQREHADLLDLAVRFARAHRQVTKRPATPAVLGFVYPDELRWREEGDRWLLILIAPNGKGVLPRPVPLARDGRFIRQPSLEPLSKVGVAVVGLGALGSPAAADLARAGVARFVLIDNDLLLAGNLVRHELDLAEVGMEKVAAMEARLKRINPFVEVIALNGRYGASQTVADAMFTELAGCQLILNTAANAEGIHEYLAEAGIDAGIPVVHAWIGPGGWGGRVIAQRPRVSGCPECLARHQADDDDAYPWEEGPAEQVNEIGCSDPTFIAAGFDLKTVASAAARAAVGLLLDDSERYPAPPDMLTLTMRTADSAVPTSTPDQLPVHPACEVCNG